MTCRLLCRNGAGLHPSGRRRADYVCSAKSPHAQVAHCQVNVKKVKALDQSLQDIKPWNGVRKVSWVTTLGYGSGDFGFNLYFAGLNLYLLYYYTDVLNIDPAVAGLIIMLPVIWDGVSDPLMGWIVTRTRSRFR